ncbi:MAG: enoyl-CoA hydratase/isomerase family protein [Pseudomonadota bacterium]
MNKRFGDVEVRLESGHVATVELRRPPNNFFDEALIDSIASAYEWLDDEPQCRAIVLAAEGKHFCAGADFSSSTRQATVDRDPDAEHPLYRHAVRLFATAKPVVAAVQGAAVGGGFGLALSADFRFASPSARFTANFVKLGFSPGFGLTHTLPRLVGEQAALDLFLTGRRVAGDEAATLGLVDRLVDADALRDEALAYARSIAENAPLALLSVRRSLRGDLAAAVKVATDHEAREQHRLQQTDDHREGVQAVAERRPGNFSGR